MIGSGAGVVAEGAIRGAEQDSPMASREDVMVTCHVH